jgi:hypothetical protein
MAIINRKHRVPLALRADESRLLAGKTPAQP